jgi:paraquat-inducible protein A
LSTAPTSSRASATSPTRACRNWQRSWPFNLLIAPGLHLLAFLYVLVPVSLNRRAPGMFRVFRYLRLLQPWHMVEIFMLGVLVSMVKLAKMAQIIPGVAVYSLTAFIFVMAAASAAVDPHEVWERWEDGR